MSRPTARIGEGPKHRCVTTPRPKGCLDFPSHQGTPWILGPSLWAGGPCAGDELTGPGTQLYLQDSPLYQRLGDRGSGLRLL